MKGNASSLFSVISGLQSLVVSILSARIFLTLKTRRYSCLLNSLKSNFNVMNLYLSVFYFYLGHPIYRRYSNTKARSSLLFSVISGLQSLVVSILSARMFLTCKDIMKDGDDVLESYILASSAYLLYDLYAMYEGN